MWPEFHYHHHHLIREAPLKLRPTQMSVGLAEVAAKRREWAALGVRERHQQLQREVFPATQICSTPSSISASPRWW